MESPGREGIPHRPLLAESPESIKPPRQPLIKISIISLLPPASWVLGRSPSPIRPFLSILFVSNTMAPAISTEPPQNTARRDRLVEIQNASQALWASSKAFEIDAPLDGSTGTPDEKFYGNFPYPYMNGLLHLGHAFSLSKLEFAAAFHRVCGKNVLFPQAFHCTGMPIKACADKLKREIETYGCPPVFDDAEEAAEEAETKDDGPVRRVTVDSRLTFLCGRVKSEGMRGVACVCIQI